ncbi:MAG: P1 family peptidase [Rhodobacteraceae bacterium]|nr:P1 family peptidase [Paracoccaceae bacterium]
MQPGQKNLITDVAGLRVGQAEDVRIKTGVSVLVGDVPFTAAAHVMGGAPGTRETELLAPDKTVQMVDALVLSGGSAFGLDAASGVADALRIQGRGFPVGDQSVPIVPGAILFDLTNGGRKNWARNPYKLLGTAALAAAADRFKLGSAGAGTGALIADLKGGIGSASLCLDPFTVGALVAVNALGRVTVGEGAQFWAAPFEFGDEFGGLGTATVFDPAAPIPVKGGGSATTIAIVATDARLSQAQATRMAVVAHDGMARAIYPSHTPMDGDLVFSAATGAVPLAEAEADLLRLGHAAALCLARAIARGVYAATPAKGDLLPAWAVRHRDG